MNGIKHYKHNGALWDLQEKIRKEKNNPDWHINAINGKPVIGLCYSCRGEIYSKSSYYRYTTDADGNYILICSECYAS